MKNLIYIIILLLLNSAIWAGENGGSESPFSIGAGASNLALGGASISECDDATATYWNPSGLSYVQKITLTGFYSRLYDSDVGYQYFGLAYPTLDWGTLGIGVFRLGIDGIEERDVFNQLNGEFSDSRMAYYLAYANQFSGYSAGISFMIEQHTIGDFKATSSPGMNISLGRRFKFENKRINSLAISLVGRNILQPSSKLDLSDSKQPSRVDFGLALSFQPIGTWENKATLFAKLSKIENINPKGAFGLELDLYSALSLRGGIENGKLSAGAGIKYNYIEFDYALIDRDMGNLHMFSLSASFGSTIESRQDAREKEQEQIFNRLMNEQLNSRNSRTVADLLASGQDALENGMLTEAVGDFEKGLFIARSNNLDTTQLADLLEMTREKYDEIMRRKRFGEFLDSAETKMKANDYLGAKYYAIQALNEFPNSQNAEFIIDRANGYINEVASLEKLINEQLQKFDSLMSYGQLGQARIAINQIAEISYSDERIVRAIRKIDFETTLKHAQMEYEHGNYNQCISLVDSALVLFPGHDECRRLKAKADAENSRKLDIPIQENKEVVNHFSDEYLKLAEEKNESAMESFRGGKLDRAIAIWEEVENIVPNYKQVRQYLIRAYKYVGVELYGQNRLEDAIAIWQKALVYDQDNQEIKNYIERSRSELKKLKELSYDE